MKFRTNSAIISEVRYLICDLYFLLHDKSVIVGKMFPTRGDLHVVPFTDEALYMEQYNKVHIPTQPSIFWYNQDLSSSVVDGIIKIPIRIRSLPKM